MKNGENNKWLDKVLADAIGEEKSRPDFEKWQQNHRQEVEMLTSRAGGDGAASAGPRSKGATVMKSRIVQLAAAAAIIAATVVGVAVFSGSDEQPNAAMKQMAEETKKEPSANRARTDEGALDIKQDPALAEKVDVELGRIDEMYEAGDMKGLVALLAEGEPATRLAASNFLAKREASGGFVPLPDAGEGMADGLGEDGAGPSIEKGPKVSGTGEQSKETGQVHVSTGLVSGTLDSSVKGFAEPTTTAAPDIIKKEVRLVPVEAPAVQASEPVGIFFEDFDSYTEGADLSSGRFGGWGGRWGGNITVTGDYFVSAPYCARMDNNEGCWESQLYHPLPFCPEVVFSADIMAEATGRTGCHQFDVELRLYNPDVRQWGSTIFCIAIVDHNTDWHDGPGLVASSGIYSENDALSEHDALIIDPDYEKLVGRWINVQVRADSIKHVADIWIDNVLRASVALDPNLCPYAGITLDCANGIGYVDNIRVYSLGGCAAMGPIQAEVEIEPQTINSDIQYRWLACRLRLGTKHDVADIDRERIRLNDRLTPTWVWMDEDKQVLMLKFPWSEVEPMLTAASARLKFSGSLTDGTKFEAVAALSK